MTSLRSDRHTAIFTICSNNYLPFAKIFLESCRRHHPEAQLFLGLADSKLDTSFYNDDWIVVPAEELSIPDFRSFAFRYDIMEFNTAIKPYLFLHIYNNYCFDNVLYFDPDIEIYSPLASIFQPLNSGAPFVLTPHLCVPSEVGQEPDDVTIMKAGIYNLGFLGTSRSSETLQILHWWSRRLRYQCINAQDQGIFVDQKFMDLVPGFVDGVHITRDTALNVAYWNLSQRQLDFDGDQYLIDNRPLGFFHFSGFDPRMVYRLSKHTALFSESISDSLARLIESYATRLLTNGYGEIPRGVYAYGRFNSGTPIPALVRKMFRESHEDWPTDAFDTYEAFLSAPIPGAAHTPTHVVTQFLAFLRTQFPYLGTRLQLHKTSDVRELVEWFVRSSESDLHFDPRITAPAVMRTGIGRSINSCVPESYEGADVSVIGYLKTTSGVGEAGRQTLLALQSSGVRAEGIDVALNVIGARGDESVSSYLTERGSGRAKIFHVNADQLPLVEEHTKSFVSSGGIRISVPFWELSQWPDAWEHAFSEIDEIWAPSRFVQATLARGTNKRVIYMPMAIEFPRPAPIERSEFRLPKNRFLFFYAFDFLSFLDRKNPLAALAAFRRAFPTRGEAGLVFKVSNGHLAPQQLDDFKRSINNDPDITLIDGTLSRERTLGLIAASDCVLSLHRSEGLGLLVAEAMLLEKPVIATDYSATTDLVTLDTGYPVDYRVIPVTEGKYPHSTGQVWAEVDVRHAAWLMRDVFKGGISVAQRVRQARRHMVDTHSRSRVGINMRERLIKLGAMARA